MNDVRRIDRPSEETARLGAMVRQHTFPDFVSDFSLRFGEVEGEPAVWVVFRTKHDLPSDRADADRWIKEANVFANTIREHMIDSGELRFPLFRFQATPRGHHDTN